jgi:hypothetical protein
MRRGSGSGPLIARLFQRVLAVFFVVAWASLASQVRALIGSRGLQPFTPALAILMSRATADRLLTLVPLLGAGLAIAAFFRWRPRLCLLLTTALYYGYAAPLQGVWYPPDDLLLECGLLAALLSDTKPAPIPHLILRLVLVKLYVMPGIAKLVSRNGDWIDGSAMLRYYEVTPVPAPLAWYLHQLPAAWHHIETWGVLVVELLVPLLAFGKRRWRLAAAATLTAFQVLNIATANFGWLPYLSLALNLFLLDDADVERAAAWLRRSRDEAASPRPEAPSPETPRRAALVTWFAAGAYVLASGMEVANAGPSRVLHAFHAYRMFGDMRSARIDPELQTFDGESWSAQPLRYLPASPNRALAYVAPHLPRLDVRLGFTELERPLPPAIGALLVRLCDDPEGVQDLFEERLPPAPRAVRVVFFRDRFTTAAERRSTDATWHRDLAQIGEVRWCDRSPSPTASVKESTVR